MVLTVRIGLLKVDHCFCTTNPALGVHEDLVAIAVPQVAMSLSFFTSDDLAAGQVEAP